MSECKSQDAATTKEGCQEESDNSDMVNEVEDKVSIQQILEGMTNEFNKSVSPVKSVDAIRPSENPDHEEPQRSSATTIVDEISNGVDGNSNVDNFEDDRTISTTCSTTTAATSMMTTTTTVMDITMTTTSTSITSTTITATTAVASATIAATIIQKENNVESITEENHYGEDEGAPKQDVVKKDSNIPRIVLTFRTIDENTDHGKKTKISSCSSNLTLVPDELANCDQIGGVSVKIENPDESSDNVEKSDSEECKIEEGLTKNNREKDKEEEKQVKEAEKSKHVEPVADEKNNEEMSNIQETAAKAATPPEPTPPITRKRRVGRPRLRTLRFFIFCYFIFLDICS